MHLNNQRANFSLSGKGFLPKVRKYLVPLRNSISLVAVINSQVI